MWFYLSWPDTLLVSKRSRVISNKYLEFFVCSKWHGKEFLFWGVLLRCVFMHMHAFICMTAPWLFLCGQLLLEPKGHWEMIVRLVILEICYCCRGWLVALCVLRYLHIGVVGITQCNRISLWPLRSCTNGLTLLAAKSFIGGGST